MSPVQPLKILIACEYSGIVSQAFAAKGHKTLSVDLLPAEHSLPHFQGSVFDVPGIMSPGTFDLMIAHPPCTYLCRAQAHLLVSPDRMQKHYEAIDFVRRLIELPIDMIAIENPIGYLSKAIRPPEQIIYPWQFGDPYRKDVCLWLKNLPPLLHTEYSSGRKSMSNHVNSRMSQALKSKIKSRFFKGIAVAMANQWS